jgi:hypothetical protein
MTAISERDRAIGLEQEIEDIRAGLAELQGRFERVMRDVRHLPGGQWLSEQVDAYPGIRLDRDMGAGKGADGWIEEVAGFLQEAADAAVA